MRERVPTCWGWAPRVGVNVAEDSKTLLGTLGVEAARPGGYLSGTVEQEARKKDENKDAFQKKLRGSQRHS
jgi:hypothetical protein